jgi:hypothetical protein
MKVKTQNSKIPPSFKPLFWSYKFSSINLQKNKKTIIINTINYGQWEHWVWVSKFYGKENLKKIIEEIPQTEFRPPALKLISLLLGIKKLKYVSRSDYIRSQKNIQKT